MIFSRNVLYNDLKVDYNEITKKIADGIYSVKLLGLDDFARNDLCISTAYAAKALINVNKQLVTEITFTDVNTKTTTVNITDKNEQSSIFIALVTTDPVFMEFTIKSATDFDDDDYWDDEEDDEYEYLDD